jgi:hypothetical protein
MADRGGADPGERKARTLVRERPIHTQAYADYVALGPGRTLKKLWEQYREYEHPPVSPTPSGLSVLKNWSRSFDWQGRIDREVARGLATVEKAATDERLAILATGYAQQHERIAALNRLAGAMLADLFDDAGHPTLYATETLATKDGAAITRRIFKKPQVEQFRGLLDDLAKETGGRSKNVNLTGTMGGDVTVHHVTEDEAIDRTAAVLGVLASLGVQLPGLAPPPTVIEGEATEVTEH